MTCTECNGDRVAGAPTAQREPEAIDDDEAPETWQLAIEAAAVSDGLGGLDDRAEDYEAEAAERFDDPDIRAAWVTLRRAGIDLPTIVGVTHGDGSAVTGLPRCATCGTPATVWRLSGRLCWTCYRSSMKREAQAQEPSVIVTEHETVCHSCHTPFKGAWPPSCCEMWAGGDQ